MTPVTSIYEYAKHSMTLSADRPAIWFRDKAMTYRTMFRRIDDLADHLAQLGVKLGTVVTIHLPNCPQAVMSIYAVAKLGGICNMVHPQMPAQALKNYMSFTESTVLISYDRALLDQQICEMAIYVEVMSYLKGFSAVEKPAENVYSFDALVQPATDSADIPDQAGLAEKCVAYMHSTGTTGIPKTVMLSHKAVNAWIENLKEQSYGTILHEMVYLSFTPPFHCLGFVGNVHQAVSFGAQSVMLPQWNCDVAIDAIRKYHVTYITNVPTVYREMLRHPGFSGEGISHLTHCMIGGEEVPPALIRALDQRIGKGRVARTAFGSTEVCGAFCGLYLPEHKITASGYPLKGNKAMVLGGDGVIRAIGEGELVVASESLMMGYLKDPKATEEALLEHDGCFWLKTGDYGRIDEDGAIYFISRIKDIIIRKGHNVFPTEVEKAIRGVSGVYEVCVLGIPDRENATETVCAVIVAAHGADEGEITESVLQECRKTLPHYAVPGKFVFTSQIPRNQMGKADRKAMKEQL